MLIPKYNLAKMRILFFLSLFAPLLAAAATKTTISGNITNSNSADTLTLQVPHLYIGDPEKLTSVAQNGKFDYNFELDEARQVLLTYNKQIIRLYAEPGDELSIKLNNNNGILEANFEGKGAANNQFMHAFYTQFKDPFNPELMTQKVKSSTVDAVEMYLFDSRKQQNDFVGKYAELNKVSNGCKEFIKHETTYNYYNYVIGHPIIVANSKKDMLVSRLPQSITETLDDKLANNTAAINSPAYREFLVNYTTYFTSEMNKFMKFTDYGASLNMKYNYARQHLKGDAFLYAMSHFTYSLCEKSSADVLKKVYSGITEADKSGKYANLVKQKCEQWINAQMPEPKETAAAEKGKGKGKKGKNTTSSSSDSSSPASAFRALDLEGNQVGLDQFKGKVIYVDFWASWCGPCRQQFPFAKALHEKFSAKQLKQLVFLYISIDDNEQKWKDSIEKLGIKGYHTLSTGGWGSEAAKAFGLNSIPRYMLIDKKGNIANANAPRPSSDEIANDIIKLLNQKK
jgi:thiol-disulfide isomerase/thioredoxin